MSEAQSPSPPETIIDQVPINGGIDPILGRTEAFSTGAELIDAVPLGEASEAIRARNLAPGIGGVTLKLIDTAEVVEEGKDFKPDFDSVFEILDQDVDTFSDPKKRLDWIRGLDPDQFGSMLDKFHSLLTPEQFSQMLQDRSAVVGINASYAHNPAQSEYVTSSIFVNPEDRVEFIKTITDQLSTIDNLDAAADVVAFGILNLHAYSDGNGRTSRLLHSLIRDGYDQSAVRKEEIEEFASPRDGKKGIRPMSFNVSDTLKQAILDQIVPKRKLEEAGKNFKGSISFKDKYGLDYVSSSITSNFLNNVVNPETRRRLIKVMQQSDFGEIAITKTLEGTTKKAEGMSTIDTYMRLESINDDDAEQIIENDKVMRLAYMKEIIRVASGGKVEYTDRFTGDKKDIGSEGLTMSSAWQNAYLAAA
ncbi:Fic family protein [Candidatus Saccharibacteria bacterium]|nr:Fic family protein [Candidatus Saccharibacteria bacterium]